MRPNFLPALVVVDYQNDFCDNGSLAVPNAFALLPSIQQLLGMPFPLTVATLDFHPPDHVSFRSAHPGLRDGTVAAENPLARPGPAAARPETVEIPVWPDHCVAGTAGAAFPAALDPGAIEYVVRKGRMAGVEEYSAFGSDFAHPPVPAPAVERVERGVWPNEPDEPPVSADALVRAEPDTDTFEQLLRERAVTDLFLAGLALDVCVKTTARHALERGWKVWIVKDGVAPIAPDGWERTESELAAIGGPSFGYVALEEVKLRLDEAQDGRGL